MFKGNIVTGSYELYRCAVLSTSTGSLDSILSRDSPIQILRLTLTLDGIRYTDGLDLKPETFYQWLYRHPGRAVQTTPPTPESLRETFSYLKTQGYHEAIVTTISRRMSESHQIIRQVADEMAGELTIHVLDTGVAGMPEGFFALEALRLLKSGRTPAQTMAHLEQLKSRCEVVFSVHSLRQLTNSGGLMRIGAMFSDLLGLKPVFAFRNNTLRKITTARSSDHLLDETVAAVAARIAAKNIDDLVLCGMYCGNLELYNRFAKKLHNQTGLHLQGIPISPVLGAYIGPDAVGVGIVEKLPE